MLLAEQRYEEAEALIDLTTARFEKAGEPELLTDALVLQATVQKRLNKDETSLATFRRAIKSGVEAGANLSAARAALSLIEEHHSSMTVADLLHTYERADNLPAQAQHADLARLRNCARIIVERLKLPSGPTLSEAMMVHESQYLEQALVEENGSVTRAARRLGLTHQGLASILKTRHQHLLEKRTPIVTRRKSIIRLRQDEDDSSQPGS